MRQDRPVYIALSAWENVRRGHAHGRPAAALVSGAKDARYREGAVADDRGIYDIRAATVMDGQKNAERIRMAREPRVDCGPGHAAIVTAVNPSIGVLAESNRHAYINPPRLFSISPPPPHTPIL